MEKNYDFRKRHWAYHKPDRRDFSRTVMPDEVQFDENWSLGSDADPDSICGIAIRDFRDYLETIRKPRLTVPLFSFCSFWSEKYCGNYTKNYKSFFRTLFYFFFYISPCSACLVFFHLFPLSAFKALTVRGWI